MQSLHLKVQNADNPPMVKLFCLHGDRERNMGDTLSFGHCAGGSEVSNRGNFVSRKVAIIGTRGYPSYYGGFETAVRKLAPYLADAGWDVTVYGRPGATKLEDAAKDPRVKTPITWGVESKSLSTLTFGLTAVVDAVRKKPDVVLVMNVANGFWLPLLKLRGIPTLVNVDGIEWERAKWGRLAKALFRFGAQATARWGSEMIYDARAIALRWKDEFNLDGYVIPYGGDEPGTLPVPSGLEARRYVLMVARFVPENSIQEFMSAVRLLKGSVPVVIVGSSGHGGEFDEAMHKLSIELPNVSWLGHLDDHEKLLGLWQHAGAYFHGHSVGGTNPALVQAMACGAPTVARDTVYNREVLESAGVFVLPTPSDIAEGLQSLLDDPGLQGRLSAEAVVRAKKCYSWEAICSAYESALDEVRLNSKSKNQKTAVKNSISK